MRLLTTQEAAVRLGITRRGVRKLIERGRLRAVRFGWAWVIEAEELEAMRERRRERERLDHD